MSPEASVRAGREIGGLRGGLDDDLAVPMPIFIAYVSRTPPLVDDDTVPPDLKVSP